MAETLLEQHPGPDLAVFVVWSTQAGAKERHVPAAAALMRDRRVRHYWDPQDRVGTAYQPVVGTSMPAWDVWMLFDRPARWGTGGPPRPSWWEHQLRDLPAHLRLDPERFAARAAALLSRPGG